MFVKLLEIRALWTREHDRRAENYVGLDIYLNSLGQIYIPMSGLSPCGVCMFFGRAFLYKSNELPY